MVSAGVGLCLHLYMHTHTHTPLAIFEVIQQTLLLASSSLSEPPTNNLTWGGKGMSHTEVNILKVEKVHKCLSKMFLKKGQKRNHFTELSVMLTKQSIIPWAFLAAWRRRSCSSLLLCRAPFFWVFPSGLMFHWPINVPCNYTDIPLLLCSPSSLYFLYFLYNIVYSNNM